MTEPGPFAAEKLRVACIMMQRDEDVLLRPWVSYHAALFGMENLFVFDNGSKSEFAMKEVCDLASIGLNVDSRHTSPEDYDRKGEIIGAQIRSLKNQYDFFIPLDCDEFFVLKTAASTISCDPALIRQALEPLRGAKSTLRISEGFYNILGYSGWYWCWPHGKTFFAESFQYLDHGYHSGRTENGLSLPTDFAHMHYHHKPYPMMVNHAKNKLRPYVDVEDRIALSKYRGTAHHCVKPILEGADAYMSRFNNDHAVFLPAFPQRLRELGVAVPFD